MEDDTPVRVDPSVMLGKPTVAGTRITVDLILERLAGGEDGEQVVGSYPRLTGEGLGAALTFAAIFLQNLTFALVRAEPRRFGGIPTRATLREVVEVLTGDAFVRRGSLSVPGEIDGGFVGSVIRKVAPAGIDKVQAFGVLGSVTLGQAMEIMEVVAVESGPNEELLGGLPYRSADVRIVLAFASEVIRMFYVSEEDRGR